jgi:hypothetical protein
VAHLFILSEDDSDDQAYAYLLESLLGTQVDVLPRRLRRGGGVGEVRKKLPLLVSDIRRMGWADDTFFLVAVDNDRTEPTHATHLREGRPHVGTCRNCMIADAIAAGLPDGRPIPGAVAVPVEMIEAWLLVMHDRARYPDEAALPRCSRRDQPVARDLYGHDPPPQLKDLVEAERLASRLGGEDFVLACVMRLDAADLAARSPSFAHLRSEVAAWRAASGSPAG